MEILRVSSEQYAGQFEQFAPHIYNTVAFSEHNREKSETLHHLVFSDGSPRLGIIAGEKEGELRSPFSAPFGGFSSRGRQSIEHIAEAVRLLSGYAKSHGLRTRVTLPPALYAPSFIAHQAAALSLEATKTTIDTNHHRTLDFEPGNPESGFSPKGRNTLKSAMRQGLTLHLLDSSDPSQIMRAYEIIRRNHAELGHPLRMTFDEVVATAPITGSRFMTVARNGVEIAAAMVNATTPDVAQVIYWGDTAEGRRFHPMNFLAAALMENCRQSGIGIIDIGPSSENGIPATGLCRFKESIGCTATTKISFIL
ncbi:MAG: GNAT family N-acetyltransferase [Paramuribaculum sp.]|nr:GNAT family N-acetyltransferase [Paramuribaculum sp.]MDE6488787.1 GNAT family N-acetyltransferase [Paramuribaculum sp.]